MKIAVLGTGDMGKLHASIYKSFSDIETVIIVGRDKDKTEKIAKELNINWSGSPQEIFDDNSIDSVDICLPTDLHADFVTKALKAKKNVFCEVPIALNINDAKQMVAVAGQVNKIFGVAQLMRFVADINYTVERTKSGLLGNPLNIYAYRHHSFSVTDPIIELMSFEIDTCLRIMGMPEKVFVQKTLANNFITFLEYPNKSCLVETSMEMSHDFPLNHGLRVICSDGIIETSTALTNVNSPIPQVLTIEYLKLKEKRVIEVQGHDPYRAECRYFVDSVFGKVDGKLIDAGAAVDTLRVALAIKESLSTKHEIGVK